MNNFTGIGQIAKTSELTYQGQNQTPMIKVSIDMMTRYTNTGDRFTVEGIAWGKVADQIVATQDGAVLLIVGQLNILSIDRGEYTEKLPSIKITEIVTRMPELIAFNQVEILGNVGQEVDAKYFESGKNKASFSLAVRRTKNDTDWFGIELWGDTAKVADQYVAKGSKVGVVGHLKIESWTDKNTGAPRSKPVILGDRLSLAGKGESGGESTDEKIISMTQATRQLQSSDWSDTKDPTVASKWEQSSNEAVEPDFDDIPF